MGIAKHLILIIVLFLGGNTAANQKNENSIRYWFWWPARTLDTHEADRPPVMQVARNIYAPLVSEFMDGRAQGLIAESWTVSKDQKQWRFKIRKGLKFETGEAITPAVVVLNFKRILFLTKEEGLTLNSLLPECKKLSSINQKMSTLRVEGDDLVFDFSKPPISLFEAITQPVYGIANPKCFDLKGKWLDPKCTSESGQYKIIKFDDNKIILKNRHIYTELKNAPEIVEIHSPVDSKDNVVQAVLDDRGDLTIEHSFGVTKLRLNEIKKKGLKVLEEPPVRMHFVHLNYKKKPLSDRRLRQLIRNIFLNKLKNDTRLSKADVTVNPSFIPLGGVGYLDLPIIPVEKANKTTNKEKLNVLFFPIAADKEVQTTIEDALIGALQEIGFDLKVDRYTDRFEPFSRMRKGDFDVIVRGTGILVNNPYGDLRMMFMSKLGALIPDATGKIPALIESAELESDPNKRRAIVEKINHSIHEESAIITFAHSRLLYIHNHKVDLSRLNLFVDPIEFRAVGINEIK